VIWVPKCVKLFQMAWGIPVICQEQADKTQTWQNMLTLLGQQLRDMAPDTFTQAPM